MILDSESDATGWRVYIQDALRCAAHTDLLEDECDFYEDRRAVHGTLILLPAISEPPHHFPTHFHRCTWSAVSGDYGKGPLTRTTTPSKKFEGLGLLRGRPGTGCLSAVRGRHLTSTEPGRP